MASAGEEGGRGVWREGAGGGGGSGGGHVLAEVLGEAILVLGGFVTTLPVHTWKAQEVSMVLNGFARYIFFFARYKKMSPKI